MVEMAIEAVIFIHYKPQIVVNNSRHVVDEEDLKWVAMKKNILLLKQFHEIFLP